MGGGSMSHSPSFSQPRAAVGFLRQPLTIRQSRRIRLGVAVRQRFGIRQSQPEPGSPCRSRRRGAGYANRNDSNLNHPGAAGAAAGAGYANRNDSTLNHPGAAGAAAGAGYAYNHTGMGNGYWGGNYYSGWGATGMGMGYASGVGAWGAGSPMYGWGYSGYNNPYYGGGGGAGGVAQARPYSSLATLSNRARAGFRLLPADQHDRPGALRRPGE